MAQIYDNLLEISDDFPAEAIVISEVKCELANKGSLADFISSAGAVYVMGGPDRYTVTCAGLSFEIETDGRMIADYSIL